MFTPTRFELILQGKMIKKISQNSTKFISSRKKGFGILEVLLASVIIIIILGALVFLVRGILNKTTYYQERLQATMLAQDGIEKVRQIRDTNYIDANPATEWSSFVLNTSNIFIKPVLYSGNPLNIYYSSYVTSINRIGLTTTTSAEDVGGTKFTRQIFFESPNELMTHPTEGNGANHDFIENINNNAYRVTSRVTWTFLGDTKTIEIKELVTNSRQRY